MTPPDPRHEQLAEYVLGTLEPEAAASVEAYVEASSAARAEVRALRVALVALTEALPPQTPPPSVWDRIEAGLTAERPPPPARRRPPPWLGWGVAALLALVTGAQLVWTLQTGAAYRQTAANERRVAAFLAQPAVGRVALQGPAGEGLGSVLLEPGGDALFVLTSRPAAGRVYQAWGHATDDWEPGSGEPLTPLGTSDRAVFEVSPGGFASLYLSLEPAGGSVQPTEALAHVSLQNPPPRAPLELLTPEDGMSVTTDRVIVSGRLQGTVSTLRYRVNGGEPVTTPVAGTRFSFTASGLRPGENTLEVTARLAGEPLSARVTVVYTPPP